MKVVIRGVHLELTSSLRRHVMAQLAEPLERFLPQEAAELAVYLLHVNGQNKGGIDKECRVTLHIPYTPPVHLSQLSEDIYKSVSLLKDRLETTAKRHLERHRSFEGDELAQHL